MSYNLFLDDVRKPMYLGDTRSWEVVRSYDEFVNYIEKNGLPILISFDHDLAPEHYQHGHTTKFESFDYNVVREKTGYHCADWLVNYCLDNKLQLPDFQVHSMNPCGRENIEKLLSNFRDFQKENL